MLSSGQAGPSAGSDLRRPFSAKKLVARAVVVGAAGLALYVVLPSLTKVIARGRACPLSSQYGCSAS